MPPHRNRTCPPEPVRLVILLYEGPIRPGQKSQTVPSNTPHLAVSGSLHGSPLPITAGYPHHSGVSPPERPEMVKFVLNFCYCAVDQERPFLKGNGPFLANLPFWTRGLPTTAGSPHRSGSSPPQRGLPTTAGSPHHSGVSPPQRGLPRTSGVPSSSFSMKGRKSVPTRAFLPLNWGGP